MIANTTSTADNAISNFSAVNSGPTGDPTFVNLLSHLTPSNIWSAPNIAQTAFKIASAKISAVF